MTDPKRLAANILRVSAAAYGSAASSMLLERNPAVQTQFGPGGWSSWRGHLSQRILDLAAAIGSGVPELFVERVQWTRKAFTARGVPQEHLVASLDCLRQVLDAEAPVPVREAAMPVLAAAADALDAPLPEDAPGLSAQNEDGRLALAYLLSALEGDALGAMRGILDACTAGRTVHDLLVNVLMPVQTELGQMWHSGDLAITQEHCVTSTTERLMALLADRVERAPPIGRAVLLAAVSGDTHVVGARALSYLFEIAGWRAVYLGGDVPDTDIAAAAEYFDVDLVLLAATLPTQLSAVESTITALREIGGRRRPVVVGGLAYARAPDLWRAQGADGYGQNADAALDVALRLTGDS